MTSARILFPQFRDEQSASKYPFADDATLTSTTGIRIDNDLFIDASFFGINLGARIYISSVVVAPDAVTIVIGDESNTAQLAGNYSTFDPPTNGVINFVDSYGRPAGMLLVRNSVCALSQFSTWPVGQHNFTLTATEFVASVVIPAREPGVRALTPEPQQLQTGDVWLIGNNGIVLRAEDEHTIRVDVVGVPLFRRATCDPQTNFPTKQFLRTINGCGPDEYGNFIITATSKAVNNPAIRVYPTDGTLKITTIGS